MNGRGFGIRLPLSADQAPRLPSCSSEAEHIRQSVAMILRTRPGTRPLLPEYGCRIHQLLFRPVTPALRGQIAFFVEVALDEWEPRIEVREVSVNFGAGRADPGSLHVRVSYEIRNRPGVAEQVVVAFLNGVGSSPEGDFA